MSNELISKAVDIMKAAETAVIALIDENGFPRASTISCIKTEGINHAWFATGLSTGKARCIRLNNKAGLCYCDGNNNITLMGTIEILTDADIKKGMWVDWFINHFAGGVTDLEYCILKFSTKKVVFWIDSIYKELDINEISLLEGVNDTTEKL
jgi:general stress protein 26